jgi:hypothetical protein
MLTQLEKMRTTKQTKLTKKNKNGRCILMLLCFPAFTMPPYHDKKTADSAARLGALTSDQQRSETRLVTCSACSARNAELDTIACVLQKN